MKGSIKFAAAATGLIIALALLLGVSLGIYSSGRSWIRKNSAWGASKNPSGTAAQAWMDDAQTLKTSTGQVTISASIDEARLGAPIYPGADRRGTGTVLYSGAGAGSEEFVGAQFTTSDDFDKVLAFYKGQVSPKAHVDATDNETQSRAVLSLSSTDGQDTLGIYILRKKESAQTEIAIHRGIERSSPAATRPN